jgi:hypothetical protein
MVALQDDLTGWGELVFGERRLVRRVGDLVLLGRDGLCGCTLQGGMGILEVESVVQGARRSVIDFRYMNVCMVRRRKK